MTKGKNTAAIGKREERAIVKDLQALGYDCRRQPGSGNRAVDLQHDVCWFDSPAGKLHIEDKYRDKSQWQRLEAYRAGADILTVRCHAGRTGQNGERMAFLPWSLLLELVGRPESRDMTNSNKPIARGFSDHPKWPQQAVYTPPPKRKAPQPRKLRGRGFQKAGK